MSQFCEEVSWEQSPSATCPRDQKDAAERLWQLIRRPPSNGALRLPGHAQLHDEEQGKYADHSYCNSLQKIDKNLTDAHSIIVQSPRTKSDITIRLVLWCAGL